MFPIIFFQKSKIPFKFAFFQIFGNWKNGFREHCTSNGNNFSFNGEYHNQRNKVVINDQSNPTELLKIKSDIINFIDIKFNEQNKVNSAIIGMLKTIREDQKQIIKINTISQEANEIKRYDKEFLNA